MSQTGSGGEFAAMLNMRQNPDHKKVVYRKLWMVWCIILSGLGCLLCLLLAGLFLLFTMELKFSLIYEWGDCYNLKCHDPSVKHGFSGFLSMVACDILLALTLNVATGELCKAFAYRIAKMWNFRSMVLRQFVEHFTASFVDVLATIGMFSYLAFSFLPEWETTVETAWDDASGCEIFWDYKACRVLRSCAPDDMTCCSGSLFCTRSKLNFYQRREVFEAWLAGLFVVAPFVEILVLFFIPLLAYLIHVRCELVRDGFRDVDENGSDRPSGLGRLVGFIFLLDGGCGVVLYLRELFLCCLFDKINTSVLGLPYIWKGFPFKAPKITLEENPKAMVWGVCAFGPYCTECKRDMHWTGKNSKGWKCRHHAVCGSSEESKGAERHCAKCGDDICGECHPQGAAVIGGLFGPLDQRLLRPMDPLDELKLLKLNFMVMVLFAPINPWGLIFQMLARQLDLHSRLPKLLMVRRRGNTTDNRLAHASQNLFGLMILPVAALWHVGGTVSVYDASRPSCCEFRTRGRSWQD
ncbi:unnamed protein product [Symbiodinium natans]|uniref:Uncharacterized protein n=1 Tax=Symbiodinium natans TaxID=878477 RepID=A0A812U563_9DINO|nr:unnamed protein product [Symbiodinium natans]